MNNCFLNCYDKMSFETVINNGYPENHLNIVQLLINSGLDLNNFDDFQETALMLGMFK
jgi:hypothetical protein